jgi:hypothetical protein
VLIALLTGMFIISCDKSNPVISEDQINEEAISDNLLTPLSMNKPDGFKYDFPADAKWGWSVHDQTMYICARQWGVSTDRANMMSGAAHMPDVYDVEGQIPGTNNWRHGYVYQYGIHIWGNADENCNNNIRGSGFNGKSAFYYYENGNKSWGDWYLGYASHYMQDVGNPWHTSANIVQQLDTHGPYETWVGNNWTSGHNFKSIVENDWYYYSISDPKASVVALAKWSNGKNTTVRDAYVNSGKPTGSGTGNSTLISETKELLKASARYTKGLIKYTLDAKSAW